MLPLTIPEAFAAVAARRPDHPCLVWGDDAIPYAAAHERIGRVAAGFVRLGAGPGDRVACYLGNGPEFLWTWLGVVDALPKTPTAKVQKDRLRAELRAPPGARSESQR